jgi:hypothetical protein
MKPPLRFSLLGLFAAMTIVALAIALYLTSSRLAVAQAEVLRLRQETGHLTIDDPSQVHLIAVPTTDAMHWRWRVYLPGGHDFGIHAHRGTFDKQGWPAQGVLALDSRIGGQTDPNLPREILLDVSLDKTLEGNACLRVRENGEGYSAVYFDTRLPSWLTDKMYLDKVAATRSVVAADPDTPLGLLRLDGADGKGTFSDDAVLIWIGKYEKSATVLQSLKDRGVLPKGN